MKTTAIIPVKRREQANERLSLALPEEARPALAEAMFFDTLSNARRCSKFDEIIVVTADEDVARTGRWLGAEILEIDDDSGHSADAVTGVKRAISRGAERVALLPADCPMLDPAELDPHLGLRPRSVVIVPDRHGTGTNALILSPPDAIEPAFGPGSCARHVSRARAAGFSFGVEAIESLGLDLDTLEDLIAINDALALNPERAPRTAALVWELGQGREESAPTAV